MLNKRDRIQKLGKSRHSPTHAWAGQGSYHPKARHKYNRHNKLSTRGPRGARQGVQGKAWKGRVG